MSFAAYSKYRDTGLAWAPSIPSHWQAVKAKHVVQFTIGWTPPTDDSDSFVGENLWANISDLGPRTLNDTARRVSDDAVRKSGVSISPAGSLLFSFKLSIGQVSFAGRDMYTNEAIATFLPSTDLCLNYAYYLLPFCVTQNAEENIYGAKLLNQRRIRDAYLLLPPPSEQQEMVAFLDRETAKLDALLFEYRRVIDLLLEKRQSLLHHTFHRLAAEKGVGSANATSSPPLTSTWSLVPLGSLCTKVGSGKTPSGGSETYVSEGVLFLRSQNVRDEGLDLQDVVRIADDVDAEMVATRVQGGDILLNITGASLGRTCLVPDDIGRANVNQHVCIIRLKNRALAPYVSLAMRSPWLKSQYDFLQNGAAREGLNFSQIRRILIPLAPLADCLRLAENVAAELQRIDHTIAHSLSACGLLLERRASLISAVVTGQIDVRTYRTSQELVPA